MKKTFLAVTFFFASFATFAQLDPNSPQKENKTDNTNTQSVTGASQKQLSHLLSSYYNIKNALVTGHAGTADCPMKKASWLSAEQVIRNPYYGNSMLTCGQVTETL